jgi:hypothetical protein
MAACSACAGDYEDPDRTAWPAGSFDADADEWEPDDRKCRGAIETECPASRDHKPDAPCHK